MNDNLILSEFAATLTAHYSSLATQVPNILHAQAAADTERPVLTISGEWTRYTERRMGALMLELRSRIGDETEGQHQSRFELLLAAFMGEQGEDVAATKASFAAAKVTLKTHIAARGKVTITDYGQGENFIEASVEGDDLVTVIHLRMVWQFVPQI